MKYLIKSTVVISSIIACSCTTAAIPSPVSVAELKSAQHDGRRIFDIAKKWTKSEPRAADSFAFEDVDAFDMQLHRSLKSMERVQVEVDETYSPTNLPTRLEPWFTTIQNSEGTVRVCTIDSNFFGLSAFTNLVYNLVKGLDDFVTYAPANAFDAEILINSFEPNKVVRIEFISRFSDRNRREACTLYEPIG